MIKIKYTPERSFLGIEAWLTPSHPSRSCKNWKVTSQTNSQISFSYFNHNVKSLPFLIACNSSHYQYLAEIHLHPRMEQSPFQITLENSPQLQLQISSIATQLPKLCTRRDNIKRKKITRKTPNNTRDRKKKNIMRHVASENSVTKHQKHIPGQNCSPDTANNPMDGPFVVQYHELNGKLRMFWSFQHRCRYEFDDHTEKNA